MNDLTRDSYRIDGSFGTPFFYLGLRGAFITAEGSADGTFDELMFLTRSTSMAEAEILASDRFPLGRYSKEDKALDPLRPEYRSCPVPAGKGSRVIRVDWTLALPRVIPANVGLPEQWPSPNQTYFGTGASMASGETACAAVALLDASGNPILPYQLMRSGAALDVPVPDGAFRFGVDIRPRLSDNTGVWHKLTAPLLESPVFDDITFTLTPSGGPRLTGWREEE
jgi:hypothetical protein